MEENITKEEFKLMLILILDYLEKGRSEEVKALIKDYLEKN